MKEKLRKAFERHLKEKDGEILNVYDRYAGLCEGARLYKESLIHDSGKEQPEPLSDVVIWDGHSGEVITRCAGVGGGRKWAYIKDIFGTEELRKPKTTKCHGCPDNNVKDVFCMSDRECSVPKAITKNGRISVWDD